MRVEREDWAGATAAELRADKTQRDREWTISALLWPLKVDQADSCDSFTNTRRRTGGAVAKVDILAGDACPVVEAHPEQTRSLPRALSICRRDYVRIPARFWATLFCHLRDYRWFCSRHPLAPTN